MIGFFDMSFSTWRRRGSTVARVRFCVEQQWLKHCNLSVFLLIFATGQSEVLAAFFAVERNVINRQKPSFAYGGSCTICQRRCRGVLLASLFSISEQ